MDWTKAKTILIIALIATNVFLIYSLLDRHSDRGEMTNEKVILQLMEQRNIELEVDIPRLHPSLRIIQGEYLSVDREEIAALAQRMPAATSDYEGVAEDFLEYLGILDDETVYEETELFEDGDIDASVRFKNEVEGLQIAENYIEVYFKDGRITDMNYHWLDDVEVSPRKIETMSAAVALMSLVNQQPGAKMTITGIELVYWVPDTDMELGETVSDTAFPTWEITLASGEKKYVGAVQI
ncbi:MAG: two-component system regulatory protein YycI [Firmicutes bacterium]|nr:two-component system regulatory protein YycI [Bacillota bacterium]